MLQITVGFAFECESMEEAQELVSTWTVHHGVMLTGMQGAVPNVVAPATVLMGGSVGPALHEAMSWAPPPLAPPPVPPAPLANESE